MPENFLKKINSKIPSLWKACFISAIVCGLLAHLYKITNWLPNWDGLVFRYDAQNMIGLGRWFLPVVTALSSFYDLPFLCGLISIVIHALGAVVICKMFAVKEKITALLIGGIVVTFPAVTSVMMYNYIADGYAAAFLLSSLAAAFMTDKKPKYILSLICIALSAGIYQAYITVTVMLLLLFLIKEVMFSGKSSSDIIKTAFKFLLCGAAGMVLYYVILSLLLKITGTQLLDYQGVSEAFSADSINIIASVYVCIKSFLGYFFSFSKGISTFSILNIIIFIFTVAFYIAAAIKEKISFSKILLLMFFALMLPFGASILAFINSGVDYHNLMKMGYVVFYLFLVILYEKDIFKCPKDAVFKKWSILLFCSALIFNHIVIANVSYHKMQMAYEKSFGMLIRIADRIDSTEDTENLNKILVIGEMENSRDYSVELPPDMTGTSDGFILRADDESVKQSILCSALNDYCEKDYTFIAGDEKKEMLKNENISKMKNWPDESSVAVVEDVIVIKLGEGK